MDEDRIGQAEREVRLAILEKMRAMLGERPTSTPALLQLAEAYAWLQDPARPHPPRSAPPR